MPSDIDGDDRAPECNVLDQRGGQAFATRREHAEGRLQPDRAQIASLAEQADIAQITANRSLRLPQPAIDNQTTNPLPTVSDC